MEYKVVTEDSPNEVWATGFYHNGLQPYAVGAFNHCITLK
jgi:hypothetical protein